MSQERIAAFVEYVLRPLSEDWRIILEQVKALNIGITQDTLKAVALTLGIWHLAGEVLRALTYIAVTWIICQAVLKVWPLL